ISRSCQRATFSSAATALPRSTRANPVSRSPVMGLRLCGIALENVALWHERDISHSSVERIIFPDSCTLLDYMLVTLTNLTSGLLVYPENMRRNLGLSLGMWNSQTVLLALIRKGLTREDAYELVQSNAMKTWAAKHAGRQDANFLQQLQTDPDVARHFEKGELEKLCSLSFHFQGVKNRFRVLGL